MIKNCIAHNIHVFHEVIINISIVLIISSASAQDLSAPSFRLQRTHPQLYRSGRGKRETAENLGKHPNCESLRHHGEWFGYDFSNKWIVVARRISLETRKFSNFLLVSWPGFRSWKLWHKRSSPHPLDQRHFSNYCIANFSNYCIANSDRIDDSVDNERWSIVDSGVALSFARTSGVILSSGTITFHTKKERGGLETRYDTANVLEDSRRKIIDKESSESGYNAVSRDVLFKNFANCNAYSCAVTAFTADTYIHLFRYECKVHASMYSEDKIALPAIVPLLYTSLPCFQQVYEKSNPRNLETKVTPFKVRERRLCFTIIPENCLVRDVRLYHFRLYGCVKT